MQSNPTHEHLLCDPISQMNPLYATQPHSRQVNKAESVKEIDLPDAIAPLKKSYIDDACGQLERRYPEMYPT